MASMDFLRPTPILVVACRVWLAVPDLMAAFFRTGMAVGGSCDAGTLDARDGTGLRGDRPKRPAKSPGRARRVRYVHALRPHFRPRETVRWRRAARLLSYQQHRGRGRWERHASRPHRRGPNHAGSVRQRELGHQLRRPLHLRRLLPARHGGESALQLRAQRRPRRPRPAVFFLRPGRPPHRSPGLLPDKQPVFRRQEVPGRDCFGGALGVPPRRRWPARSGRLALFISDKVSIEVEGGFQQPSQNVGTLSPQLVLGSVSLVLNAPAGRNLFYLLGGYTRLTFRDTLPPYDFTDNALHGAIGDRLFLTDHVALRVEGRAVWSPPTNLPGGKSGGQIIGTAGLSYFTSKGRLAQARAIGWQHQWFWGGQGGVLIYKTNRQPLTYDPIIGGHWLITGKRTALYTAFEQAFFVSPVLADVAIPNTDFVGTFSFSNVRRIMGGVLAFPTQQRIQPVTGGGFALMQVLTPELQSCSGCVTRADTAAAFDAADANASKAFFWVMGGVDIRQGRLSIFGHYIITSSAKGFMLQGPTHTLQGGVRYSLGTAKEGVTEEH